MTSFLHFLSAITLATVGGIQAGLFFYFVYFTQKHYWL